MLPPCHGLHAEGSDPVTAGVGSLWRTGTLFPADSEAQYSHVVWTGEC
jgi:hypothetical protein